jgi:hypothetical protein
MVTIRPIGFASLNLYYQTKKAHLNKRAFFAKKSSFMCL